MFCDLGLVFYLGLVFGLVCCDLFLVGLWLLFAGVDCLCSGFVNSADWFVCICVRRVTCSGLLTVGLCLG